MCKVSESTACYQQNAKRFLHSQFRKWLLLFNFVFVYLTFNVYWSIEAAMRWDQIKRTNKSKDQEKRARVCSFFPLFIFNGT